MLEDLPRPKDFPFFPSRILSVRIALLLALAAIFVQLVRQCIVRGEEFFVVSRTNFLKTQSLDAPRGLISDRHGEILAYNKSNFSISIGRFDFKRAELSETITRLERLLDADFSGARQAAERLRRYDSCPITANLPLEKALPVLERQGELPGLIVEQASSRFYPHGNAFAHVLGYTGNISKGELADLSERDYTQRDWLGKTGLEARYEERLRGDKGHQTVWRDARGRLCDVSDIVKAHPGLNLVTTLDADLQRRAVELLQHFDRGAVAIVMDPQNGELLALASAPDFDLNYPGRGQDDPAGAHLNRALVEHYPPGSTFKMITALAALENGWDPAKTVFCPGYKRIPGWSTPFRCHLKWGHGSIDLETALQKSCNVFFYTVASSKNVGPEAILLKARQLGLFDSSGIDLPDGSELRRDKSWTQQKIFLGDTFQIGIGNWEHLRAMPLQLLTAYCALGNGGRLVQPHLMLRVENGSASGAQHVVAQFEDATRRTVEIPETHRRIVMRGLWRVINDPKGTGYSQRGVYGVKRLFPKEWDVFGKTATATRGHGAAEIDDAWFVAVAPSATPRVAVLVMVERGGHGGETSSPLAYELLRLYFEKYGAPTPDEIAAPNEIATAPPPAAPAPE